MSLSLREPHAISFSWPCLSSWESVAPTAMSLASVWITNTLSMFGYVRVAECIMSCLRVLNDVSCSCVHSKVVVLRRRRVMEAAFCA